MKNRLLLSFLFVTGFLFSQDVQDNFEGSGTITSWYGDNCGLDTNFTNPYQSGINTSATVLRYSDTGGQYANVRFDVGSNLDLTTKNSFSLKIYVPSSGITGSQTNQISLKLQDGTLAEPWTTQTEIIKPITLNQWQEVTFNFETDNYINLNSSSPAPIQRTDFNRVLIQINGENNTDHVLAYIDDVLYFDTPEEGPIYDYLVWSDEFAGTGAIDGEKWHHQTQIPVPAIGGWFNGEIQHYTNRVDNASLYGGNLFITAKKETYTDQGVTKQYTSARLNSKFAFKYGKVEIRAKLPTGSGTWPALWVLGKNINENGAYWQTQGYGTTTWPACGEIDIMEHWGTNQNYVQSAIHTPSSHGATVNHGGQTIANASSDFHIYTLKWTPDKMVFKVDGVTHYTYEPAVKDSNTWPFDAQQYLVFNVAMQSSVQPSFTSSSMVIDYVRVYQESPMSVKDVEEKTAIKFYPNPVKNTLYITSKNTFNTIKTIRLIDLNGRQVGKHDYTNFMQQPVSYNTQAIKSGVYFAKVYFESEKTTNFKFVKQ